MRLDGLPIGKLFNKTVNIFEIKKITISFVNLILATEFVNNNSDLFNS